MHAEIVRSVLLTDFVKRKDSHARISIIWDSHAQIFKIIWQIFSHIVEALFSLWKRMSWAKFGSGFGFSLVCPVNQVKVQPYCYANIVPALHAEIIHNDILCSYACVCSKHYDIRALQYVNTVLISVYEDKLSLIAG